MQVEHPEVCNFVLSNKKNFDIVRIRQLSNCVSSCVIVWNLFSQVEMLH